ncbi:MAG: fumarylacetoacetate hydrolase family protein, partial [Methylobacteriaceae bacterium]|nr:fumarylacetoacetate hydrolase family protein [Methylobacteriaceae bacterium]
MRLASVEGATGPTWGYLEGDDLIECADTRHPSLAAALEAADGASFVPEGHRRMPAGTFRWLPPLPAARVFCVGLNYAAHIREMGRPLPTFPAIFTRDPVSFTAHEAPLRVPRESETLDYEGELALIIGRSGRRIARVSALDHVLGWACLNDGSVREWQNHTTQFTAGKNFWRSGSWGPWIVTREEAPAVADMTLVTTVNREERQRAALSDLVFDVPALLSYLSTILPLRAGDVIATGTPGGVGAGFEPKRWLRPRDQVQVRIDGVGTLTNEV